MPSRKQHTTSKRRVRKGGYLVPSTPTISRHEYVSQKRSIKSNDSTKKTRKSRSSRKTHRSRSTKVNTLAKLFTIQQ